MEVLICRPVCDQSCVFLSKEMPWWQGNGVRHDHRQVVSSERQYFLRVPPTIQTATEAVAWNFGLSLEDYHPADET